MSENFEIVAPVVRPPVDMELTPALEVPSPPGSFTQLTPDQVHMREAVFSQQAAEREEQQVAGLLGIWTGSLLLHDLAVETFSGPEEEEKPRPQLRDDEEQDD